MAKINKSAYEKERTGFTLRMENKPGRLRHLHWSGDTADEDIRGALGKARELLQNLGPHPTTSASINHVAWNRNSAVALTSFLEYKAPAPSLLSQYEHRCILTTDLLAPDHT